MIIINNSDWSDMKQCMKALASIMWIYVQLIYNTVLAFKKAQYVYVLKSG